MTARSGQRPDPARHSQDLTTACHRLDRDLAFLDKGPLSHADQRTILVDVHLTLERLDSILLRLGGGADPHLDAAIRGVRMADAGVCEAVDALGPVPGGNSVPSLVQARRERLARRRS